MTNQRHFFTGRRTTLREGAESHYTRIHSRIPVQVETALRDSGVIRWDIWRDGLFLFHAIETTNGYAAMSATMASLGPIDAKWDALIASMLEPEAAADTILERVWSMDVDGQS